MKDLTPLGEYLRACRDRVSPEAAGMLASRGVRRVPGLRREEVAFLAGISPDYYLKLEQGRETHPSQAVLDGLAHALRLEPPEVEHLFRLAWPDPAPAQPDDDEVSENIMTLTRSFGTLPLHVNNRYLDLLYVNPLNRALSPYFREGNNLVRMVFNAPAPHDAYWRASTRRVVAHLRASVGPSDDSPALTALVSELSESNPRFTELWEQHEVRSSTGFPMAFHRPDVGHMEFRYHSFTLPATGGKMLGMFSPAPGGPSAHALALLALRVNEASAAAEQLPADRRWSFPSEPE